MKCKVLVFQTHCKFVKYVSGKLRKILKPDRGSDNLQFAFMVRKHRINLNEFIVFKSLHHFQANFFIVNAYENLSKITNVCKQTDFLSPGCRHLE